MKQKVDMHESLLQLKPMAETTILRELELAPEMQERIMERIRTADAQAIAPIRPRRKFISILLFTAVIMAGLTVMGVINSRQSTRSAITAFGKTVMVIAPVASLGGFMIKEAQRTADARQNVKPQLSPAH